MVTVVCSLACFAACEPTASPISRIPNPTAPTTQPGPAPGSPSDRVTLRQTIAGTVRAVDGGPLAGVEIELWSESEGRDWTKVGETAENGTFEIQTSLGGLSFDKKGYHGEGLFVGQYSPETIRAAIKLQPRILLAAGTRLSSAITPDDVTFPNSMSFPWDDIFVCAPCKAIDVSGADNGATLRLAWSGSTPLSLWAGTAGGYWRHDVHGSARPGESALVVSSELPITVVLVGVNSSTLAYPLVNEPVPFTLSVER